MTARHTVHCFHTMSGLTPCALRECPLRRAFELLAALLAILVAATASLSAQELGGPVAAPRGPFFYASQSLFQAFRFGYVHLYPDTAPAGTMTAQLGATWSNTWVLQAERAHLDAEMVHLRPRLAVGVAEGVELALETPYAYLGGGTLDGPIERFHETFGFGDQSRPGYRRDGLRVAFADGARGSPGLTEVLGAEDAGAYRLAPVLSARWRLTAPGAEMPVALTAAASLPSAQDANPLVERRGHDLALGIATAGYLGRHWYGAASLGGVRVRSGALSGLDQPRAWVYSVMGGLDYRLSQAHALVAQLLVESPLTRDSGTGFDEPATDLLVGWRGRPWPGVVLEAALVENLFLHTNNLDVGFHFAVSVE